MAASPAKANAATAINATASLFMKISLCLMPFRPRHARVVRQRRRLAARCQSIFP
jgi:hypothetical protein